jgi:hypothetical protein
LNPGALTAGSIPGGSTTNQVLSALTLASLDGYYGSQVRLTSAATVTYTFLGFEAAFKNRFLAGADIFDTEAHAGNNVSNLAGLASFTQAAGPGLLDFSFLTNNGAIGIANGGDNTNNTGTGPDFFASIVGDPDALSGFSLYVFLDDLGAGPDDDHDDMVVRIDVSDIASVPVPAGIVLAGSTALLGFGLARRRRR